MASVAAAGPAKSAPTSACADSCSDAAPGHVGHDRVAADLVGLVERDERRPVQRGGHTGGIEHRREQLAVIQPDGEVGEAQPGQHVGAGGEQLRLDRHRRRAGGVDVALVELAEASLLRPVGAPHRLDLVALEGLRQGAAVLGDDPGQRHGEVVAQRQVGFAAPAVLAALEDLEDQAVAFLAVLPGEGLDVLDRRRLERFEAVALVDLGDHRDHVLAAPDVSGQEVAHAARRRRRGRPSVGRFHRPDRLRQVVEPVANVVVRVPADPGDLLVGQRRA